MGKGLPAAVFAVILVVLAVSAACGGGGGESKATATGTSAATAAATPTATPSGAVSAIDIKDFDTARFTTTQTSSTGQNTSTLSGEGVIDNRQQAISVTYEGGGGEIRAIGRTIYTYNEDQKSWTSVTEPTDGQVGFGRPYWPKFWLDAADVEELGGQSLQGAETTGYRLTFDAEKVGKRLEAGSTAPVDVRQAEVEVWVDNESRYPVRLIFRLALALGVQPTRIEITSDFSDFGTEVQIEAPEGATPSEGGS